MLRLACASLIILTVLATAQARSPRGTATISAATTGVWVNVTPGNVNLTTNTINGVANYGTQTVGPDAQNPGTLYAEFNAQGIWKSTDYGQTWTGPINTGTNGSTVTGCQGGMTVDPSATSGAAATLYQSCLGGPATGMYYSTNGGVDWTVASLIPPLPTGRSDTYQPQVDPYARCHLLMNGHEQNYLIESTDCGVTWTNIPLATTGGGSGNGMQATGGTAFTYFINTGTAGTPGTHSSGGTANTWLWRSQLTASCYGTWKTTNGGTTWTQVECLEHIHGFDQIYQVGTTGTMFMGGYYGTAGNGTLYSTDYGNTWAQVSGNNGALQTTVWGTSKNVYSIDGTPSAQQANMTPLHLQVSATPGSPGSWTTVSTPSGMTEAGGQVAVVNDGTHNIFICACWNAGLWRYIEP